MPKGPKGEKRPADVIGSAIMIARIATGEIEETPVKEDAKESAVATGRMGGKARAVNLTPDQREAAARLAAQARWRKKD